MEIMLICDSMSIGGAETHVLGLAKGLCARGHSVSVVAKKGELTKRLLCECNGRARFVNLYPRGRTPIKIAAYAAALGREIKRESPCIVHTHSRISALSVDIIRRFKALPKFAFLVSAHAKYKTNAAMKLFSVWGDGCIAVSEDIKTHLVDNYEIENNKIIVIPNGIDTNEFRAIKTAEPHSVLFASRLDSDSSLGALCLCRMADKLGEKYPDIKITVVGGGSEVSRVREAAIGKKNIYVAGARTSLAEAISNASLVVGVSRVALEAMSCGKNVILFGNEGALGLLNEVNIKLAESTNFTCRGFGVKDENFLYNEIDRAFSMSPEMQTEYGESNRVYISKYHSQEKVINKTLEIYQRIASRQIKITVGGYYGFGNIGDEALLCSILAWIKREFPYADVSVLGKKNKFEGAKCVNRYSVSALFREFQRSNVFILGGGSLLQSGTSTRSLVYYCSLVSLAKLLGCKCILLSNGLGPLETPISRRLAASAISRGDFVSLRDRDSLALAHELGRYDSKACPDLCFVMDIKPQQTKRVENIKLSTKNEYILVALNGNTEKDRSALFGEIRRFCLDHRLTAVFVAMDKNADVAVSREGAERCGGIFAGNIGQAEILSLIDDAKVGIGERLHFLIFSLSRGKGFVGVGDAPKIRSFVKETLDMPTLNTDVPYHLPELIRNAENLPREGMLSLWEKYKDIANMELSEMKRIFFIEKT